MRSLYLRIYLTVVVALALFALVSGWLVQRHLDQERARVEASARDRVEAWGDLLQRSLPPADAPPGRAGRGVRTGRSGCACRWRWTMPTAPHRASESSLKREAEDAPMPAPLQAIRLDDGRTLWVMRAAAACGLRPGPGLPPARGCAPGPGRLAIGLPAAGCPTAWPGWRCCWCCSPPWPPAPGRWCAG
jgi:hypothetical protein